MEVIEEQAEIRYVRKRLYVTDDKAPALSVDRDGFVRCGLSADMTESDYLVMGVTLLMKNDEWKKKVIQRAKERVGEVPDETRRMMKVLQVLTEKAPENA